MNVNISLENPVIEHLETEDEVSEMLRTGIKAAQAGNRSLARHQLLSVTEIDPDNENAWLWLASISEYPEELLVFLKNVLRINPQNERALEWSEATGILLAKTFVQRGIEAHKQNQTGFAKQCFLQAIVNDENNEMAWLWLASITEDVEEKSRHLQKVLRINPENETAKASLQAAKSQKSKALLKQANSAAVSGRSREANEILERILRDMPEMEEAWMLKAYLAESFDDKVRHFEKVLEINPANAAAQASVGSLRAMKEAAESKEAEENSAESEDVAAAESYSESEDVAEPEYRIPQPETSFEETVEKAPEEDFAEPAEEPLEIAAQEETYESADEREEEIFALDESENEDFYSQPEEFEQTQAHFQEENVIEDSSDAAEIFEPFAGAKAAASDYPPEEAVAEEQKLEEDFAEENHAEIEEEFPSPAEIFDEELIENSDEESFEAEEIEEEVFEEENFPAMTAETNGNGNGHSPHELAACPFCRSENEVQTFLCGGCRAVLTLSDMEMLLANKNADAEMVRNAVERMESEENKRSFSADELMLLGIGYINLKNLRGGLSYLQKALKLDPNNILLDSQVNSLAIRLAEIERQESIHDTMPKDRTILVVDDSATVRKLICGKLEKSGHTVVSAIDGVDALEKLKDITPDLILLDITMPRMDGYQVCKLIRNNPETKDIPVVMISGKDGFFDKVRGRMAGTTGYITKPFGPETLMKTIEAYASQAIEAAE